MITVDDANKLVAYQRWQSGASNQAVVVANFAGVARSYTLAFPQAGQWYVHFNSDSTNYSADFGNIGSTVVTASSTPATGAVTVGPYSALILSQLPSQPQLTVTQSKGVTTVLWPNAYSTWTLQVATTLTGNPLPWSAVPAAQYQTNATVIYINPSPSSGPAYYRLRKP